VDYWALSQIVLPNFNLLKVRVFTSALAIADPTLAETRWLQQQEIQPKLSIHLGRIKKTTRIYPLTSSNSISTDSGTVKVLKYEEKGSDVALAAHLVRDAFTESASIYYVMTSDTDFEPVIAMLKNQLKVRVGILSTTKNFPKLFLSLSPDDIRHVKSSHVGKSLLKSLSP
jgi:uncharacterized LabA/DUF88 family protein